MCAKVRKGNRPQTAKCVSKRRKRRARAHRKDMRRRKMVLEEYGDASYSQCAKKRRYPSRDAADAVAARCEAQRDVSLRSYRCRYCGGWHLTHTERGVHETV